MIKNIENSSTSHTDSDEKDEEKEICKVLQRRESVPEDTTTIKLNTIEESLEHSKTVSCSSASSTSTSPASLAVNTASDPIEEQQNTTTAINCPIENTNNSLEVNSTAELADNDDTCDASREAAATATATSNASDSPRRSSTTSLRVKLQKTPSQSKIASSFRNSFVNSTTGQGDEESIVSKSSDTSAEFVRGIPAQDATDKPKSANRLSERAKKKSWYNVLYPNYKSRSQDFKKLFKEVPNDERLIVDYSCALQRDILVQGRLYVSQNYVCFHANIFRWETYLSIKWKDVTSITKEKTALVIPNAISIGTAKEKFFFATFTTRDKAFLMLFRVWQNTLMNKQMLPQEMWQFVHNCYGDELGLTTDDEDYIDPTSAPQNESEVDLDFVTALDDTVSQSSATAASDYGSAHSAHSYSNQSINQIGSSHSAGNNRNNSSSAGGGGGSSTTSSSSSGSGAKSKQPKPYFFNLNKSSLNSSTTASASGSDNKASDNNSGVHTKSKMMPDKTQPQPQDTPEEATGSVNGVSSAITLRDSRASSGVFDGKRKVSKNSRQRDESLSKNSEVSPTDVSDSSDSDGNKMPFLVTAECTSTHEGRQLVHTILPINIDTLFNLLFSKSKFLVDFHTMRKSTETTFGEWTINEEGKNTRTVNVTVQLAASVGPKSSRVTEYQLMRECSKPGELYSIDVNSENAGIPYADSFCVLMHFCLIRTVDDHTMLSVHAQIKYKKSIWGVVKGFIEKNTWVGLEDFYTSLLHALQSETCIPPAKGKGRRPRRGTAAQVRPILEEAPPAQVKPEPIENVLAAHIHAPHVPAASQMAPGETKVKYKWLSLFVIVLLCFLISLNVILLLKLWQLEDRIEDDLSSRARMPNLASLKHLPSTDQQWLELLRQQEILHETELKKWHKVLQTAIELLKKTEKTLAELLFR